MRKAKRSVDARSWRRERKGPPVAALVKKCDSLRRRLQICGLGGAAALILGELIGVNVFLAGDPLGVAVTIVRVGAVGPVIIDGIGIIIVVIGWAGRAHIVGIHQEPCPGGTGNHVGNAEEGASDGVGVFSGEHPAFGFARAEDGGAIVIGVA